MPRATINAGRGNAHQDFVVANGGLRYVRDPQHVFRRASVLLLNDGIHLRQIYRHLLFLRFTEHCSLVPGLEMG
jgi:hypothetical protein